MHPRRFHLLAVNGGVAFVDFWFADVLAVLRTLSAVLPASFSLQYA